MQTGKLNPKVNGKEVVSVWKYNTQIFGFKLEDDTELKYKDVLDAINRGDVEGLFVHDTPVSGPVISTTRGNGDSDYVNLDDLPLYRQDEDPEAPSEVQLDGSKVVAVRKDADDNITAFKLESGDVIEYDKAQELIRQGKSSGLVLHSNQVGRMIISAYRNTEPQRLDDLPTFE